MSWIDSSSGPNSDDSETSCAGGDVNGQKRVVNLIFFVIVLLLSLLVLSLLVFDQQSSPAKNQNRTWQQEKQESPEAPYRSVSKDEDRVIPHPRHSISQNRSHSYNG